MLLHHPTHADCIHCLCMIDSLIDLTLQLRVWVFVQISDWSLHGGIDHLSQVVHITSWRRRDTGTEVRLSYHPSPPSHSCFLFVNLFAGCFHRLCVSNDQLKIHVYPASRQLLNAQVLVLSYRLSAYLGLDRQSIRWSMPFFPYHRVY
jgi:hypothetical protein